MQPTPTELAKKVCILRSGWLVRLGSGSWWRVLATTQEAVDEMARLCAEARCVYVGDVGGVEKRELFAGARAVSCFLRSAMRLSVSC